MNTLRNKEDSETSIESSIEEIGIKIQNEISKKKDLLQDNISPYKSTKKLNDSSYSKHINDSDTSLSERSKYFLIEYIDRLEELKWIHSKGSEYYEKADLYITLPSIFLTSISGIISLISATGQTSTTFNYASAISIGVSASMSSLFQTLSSTLQFNTKSAQHRDVADRYGKIITKIKFEFIDHSNEDFMNDLETQILEVQNMCKYVPPMFLYEQYKIFKASQTTSSSSSQTDEENNGTLFSASSHRKDEANNGNLFSASLHSKDEQELKEIKIL